VLGLVARYAGRLFQNLRPGATNALLLKLLHVLAMMHIHGQLVVHDADIKHNMVSLRLKRGGRDSPLEVTQY
jgi:hypothetical protein